MELQQSLKELKKELKAKAKAIKASGCPGYINLSSSSIEELEAYISKWQNWSSSVEDDSVEEIKKVEADFTAISQAKTLSELGATIAKLAGTGEWENWEMNLWTKNGECQIYMKDCSYTNPKDRGYYLIKADGKVSTFISQGNFPSLPPLPSVENDLIDRPATPEERAMSSLNAQFGASGWDQRDLDDELEREEYQ